jgi:hypothetical protein
MIVNDALAVRIATRVLVAAVRGSVVPAAPLLLGLPAVLNVVAAAIGLGRTSAVNTCRQCGYDVRGNQSGI